MYDFFFYKLDNIIEKVWNECGGIYIFIQDMSRKDKK